MSRPLTPDVLIYGLRAAGYPQLSPDGTRIIYSLAAIDQTTKKTGSDLWIRAWDGSDARRLTWTGKHNGGAVWSPDGRTIAFVSDRSQKSGIYALPADSLGEAREITKHRHAIGDLAWSADGAMLAYVALVDPERPDDIEPVADAAPLVRVTRRFDYKQDNRGYLNDARNQVFVVDVATGERRQLSSLLNDFSNPRWSQDGRLIAARVGYRNGLTSRLAVIDVASGESKLIGPEEGVVGTWAWSPTGDKLIFTGDTTHTPQLDFFVYDRGSDSVRRLTEDLQWLPDAGFPTIRPPAQPVWLDDRRVLFHAFQAGASILAIVAADTGETEVVYSGQSINYGLSVDAAGRRAVQAYTSHEGTGEVVTFDLQSGESRVVTALNAEVLGDAPPARAEALRVTRGDLTIDAWLLFPADFDPDKRYPLILDVHGGPHGYYGFGFNAVQQCLATNDVLVLYSNPRGSTSYGRDFAERVLRDWGGEDYLDLQAVVDSVVNRPYVDPQRLGIYGYSYGGYMTAWTIGQTNRFSAAVCGAPCFDLESMYGTSDIGHVFGDAQWGSEPHQNPAWYAVHSPSYFAHKARTPTLIIHGEADHRCPIGQGEQMFVALKKAGCEVEFARYPDGSHQFLNSSYPEHRADALGRILGWFKQHLGDPS
jgi:dipeptidyl aminopeptidase/acylaminoacyl peptidase